MKSKLWLMAVCSTLLAAAASGQNAPAAGTNADSANACVRKGTEFINHQNPGEALKAFEQASALQPDNERAALGQYISLVQLKQVNDGAKVLDKWVAAKADDPRRWLCKAMAEAQTDRPEAALKSFEKLTELQPNEGGGWGGKGEMLVALKRDDEALKAFDRAISLNPKHEGDWNDRGGVLLRLGKYDEAIQSYDQSINLAPKWEDSFYHRACAYAGKGDKTNALADLKQAIELQPSLKAEAVKEAGFKNLQGDPDFKKLTSTAVQQAADGTITLRAADAQIDGSTARLEDKGSGVLNVGWWTNPADQVRWDIAVTQPGTFTVELTFACDPNAAGSEYEILAAGEKLSGTVAATQGYDDFTTVKIGSLKLSKAGPVTLAVKPVKISGVLMNLQTLVLRREAR